MNNKDLFNAINDIDEKFIADAGKYLNDEDSDDPLHPEAVEIFPGETRFSPIKLVSSLVAAAVLIMGITLTVKHFRGKINVDPNTGEGVSLGTASGAQGNSGTDIGTHAITRTGPLPFEVFGPDNRQLWYENITSVEGFVPGYGSAMPVVKEELTEDNWLSLTCEDFAYIAVPFGNNFNNVDNSPADLNVEGISTEHEFKRIYAGSTFGDLIVTKASSTISRLADISAETDGGNASKAAELSYNYIEFSGSITADVYLINDNNGHFYCVFRNGEAQLPLVCYNIYEHLTRGVYETDLKNESFNNGFQYAGEMPVLTLDEDDIYICERAMANSNYVKATATFDNISIECSQTLGSSEVIYNASLAKVTVGYVESVTTDQNLFGETPFDEKTEMQLRAILGSTRDISKLKSNEEIKSLTGCTDIRVFKNIDINGNYGEELYEGELSSGTKGVNMNAIVIYKNEEPVAAYEYFGYDLSRAD